MVWLERRFWCMIAENKLARRKADLGDDCPPCAGCQEILLCFGPIGLHACQTIDEMIADGSMKGPRKIYPFNHTRRRYLPADKECLAKYALVRIEP